MAHRVGILTAGGDCPGLNATIRGVARALYQKIPGIQIVGIVDGFRGLIEGESHEMSPSDFSGILTRGGTILGTARTPYKKMKVVENDVDKVASMKKNYKKSPNALKL
ncbi:MAG: 6-phosphofructokinase, partial [Oscillospiraceae bacterium]|nr:6-phosphofructokinase [Oscillospiraceae bacterium]